MKKLNSKNAKVIGDDLGIDWNEVKLDEFTIGINVEFEQTVINYLTRAST